MLAVLAKDVRLFALIKIDRRRSLTHRKDSFMSRWIIVRNVSLKLRVKQIPLANGMRIMENLYLYEQKDVPGAQNHKKFSSFLCKLMMLNLRKKRILFQTLLILLKYKTIYHSKKILYK